MSESVALLDVIKTTKGQEYLGVVDYETSAHCVIFDISTTQNPDIRMLVITWKLYYKHMRFSVFKETFAPGIKMDDPVLVYKKDIESMTTKKCISKRSKQKKKRMKADVPTN